MKSVKTTIFFIILCLYSGILSAQEPTDCIDSVVVCGNSAINLDVNGFGTQELNGTSTCGSQENNSLWLEVTVVTNGTLGFILTPESNDIFEDYDFFVYGPNVPCNNIGQAIRCSTTNPQAAGQANNLTGMVGSAFGISEGPGADGDSFVRWLDVLAGESYYIVIDRPHGNSAFSLQWIGTAQFSDPPVNESGSASAINVESCDVIAPFDDGLTTFNLTDNLNSIIGTQTNVSVSYFENESDAIINQNALSSPYSNISNPQVLFARITNDLTGCFDVAEFSLIPSFGTSFAIPTDFETCDDLNDGDDRNGQATFDLTLKNNEIANGQNPFDINITYHQFIADAETDSNPLPNLYYNSTPNFQEIFVRIESTINSNCYSTTSMNLVVNPIPIAWDSVLIQCDEDGNADGLTTFNLMQAIDEITGGSTDVSTKFYYNITDAEFDLNEIINTDVFVNTSNPQSIYVSVININSGCFKISELTLDVSITDSNNAELITCDDDGLEDGFYTFNLTDSNIDITNGLPSGLNISYFATYGDALLEDNDLGNTFTNTTPYSQIIFARVENMNDCYGISEVQLTINMLPDINEEDLAFYCLNSFPETISLNSGANILSPSDYAYSWSTNEITYEIQVNQPGIYSVIATNLIGCTKERIVTVEASNIATIQSVQIVDASQNNTVTILVSGEGSYEYALYDGNTVYASFQSSNSFENVIPGIYTIHVRDIKNDCGAVEELVSVIGFPKFFTPNNDGKHDTWQVSGVSAQFQPDTVIYIFDRFGKLIKQLNPLDKGWDGTFNGYLLPNNDYWFAVELQDGRIYKNHFTLKR